MEQSAFQFLPPYIQSIDYKKEDFDNSKKLFVKTHFHVDIKRNKHEHIAIVELNISLNRDSDTEEANAPFSLSMTVGALFKWDDCYDEDTVTSLLSINAPVLLLGYARPIIATITGNGNVPPYYLPFFNFIDKEK